MTTGEAAYDTLTQLEELDPLASEWDALVRGLKRPTPFLLHGWVRTWLRHYGHEAEPAVHVAHRDGRLVAALPLVVRRRMGLRVAGFVGGDHPFVDLILASGEEPRTAAALADHAQRSHDCAALLLIVAESTLAQACKERLRLIPRVRAPVCEVSSDFEQIYREKYSSRKRKTIEHRRNKLAKLGKLEFELAKASDELATALEDAFRLHALRWQGRFDTSGFTTPTGIDFHRDVARELAAHDIPRILTARLDGRAIAFFYYFILSGRMFCYRTAFDPALSRYSPGLLCLLAALEESIGEGVKTIELLGGTQPYKVELADRIEQLYGGVGLARGLRGHTCARMLALGYTVRGRLAHSPLVHRFYLEHAGPLLKRLHILRPGRGG